MSKRHTLYDCDICGSLHPWRWNGDCRDDANRYADGDDYAQRNGLSATVEVAVRSMEDRVAADGQGQDVGRRTWGPSAPVVG